MLWHQKESKMENTMDIPENRFIDYVGLIGNDNLNFVITKEEQEKIDKLYDDLRKLAIKYIKAPV